VSNRISVFQAIIFLFFLNISEQTPKLLTAVTSRFATLTTANKKIKIKVCQTLRSDYFPWKYKLPAVITSLDSTLYLSNLQRSDLPFQ